MYQIETAEDVISEIMLAIVRAVDFSWKESISCYIYFCLGKP